MWQRILLGFGIGLLVLCIVVVVGVYALLHNRSFHNYVLRTAQQKASTALNTNVSIQEFALNFHGISPTLDVYGIVVDGAAPYQTPPLLQVQHARVGVTITSVLRRQWYLNDLTVNSPVAQVFFDKAGHSNLPTIQSSGSSSSTNVFDLEISRVLLDHGVVLYNNRKSVMEADLHELTLKAHYLSNPKSYVGDLGYNDGHLNMAGYSTLGHDFYAKFVYSPAELQLHDATLRSGPSSFTIDAKVTNFANPKIAADYMAVLNGAEFRHILKDPTVPTGDINLSGKLDYAAQPNVPFISGVKLQGSLNSKELLVHTPQFTGPIRNVHANYSVGDGNLYVRDVNAELLGGTLNATLTTRDISGSQQSKLNAALQHVNVGALKSMVKSPALNNVGIAGKANADLGATWSKGFGDLQADVNVGLNSTVTPHQAAVRNVANTQQGTTNKSKSAAQLGQAYSQVANATSDTSVNGQNVEAANPAANQPIPVTGQVYAHYSAKTKQLTLSNSYIKTPQTTLTFNGGLNSRTGIAVNLSHVDLHQLASLADLLSTSPKPVIPPGLTGIASFNGNLRGTTSSPRLVGLLVINNLDLNGSTWRLLRANVDVSPSNAALSNGQLVSATSGQATFNVSVGLHHWSFEKSSPFKVGLNARQLQLASLAKAASVQTPITGVLSANVNMRGSEDAPTGTAQLDITRALVSGQPIQSIEAKLNSDGTAVQANLGVMLSAGTATANGTYDLRRQNYQAVVRAVGIQLGKLEAVKEKNLGLAGTLNLNASGSGNIHNPQLNATLQIPKLQVHDQTISNINLQTNVANHFANVALDSNAMNSAIKARATVDLTGEYQTSATIDTQPIPFAPLVAAYMPSQAGSITGETELHGTIRGPLKNKELLEAHFTIPVLKVNYQNAVQIGAPQPIHLDYANGVLNVQKAALTGTDTNLHFQGRVPVSDRTAPVSLLLQGTVDLKLVQLFDPDLATSGELQFNINSFGQLANPNIEGQVKVVNAAFATGEMPLGLSNGNGVLTLTRDRLQITSFEGNVGGGKVTASGAVLYRPNLQFDMAMQAHGIRLLYPDGVRSGISANMYLSGTENAATLRGQVNLYQLSFTPDFDLTSVMGQFGGATTPPPAQGFSNNLNLQLAIRTPNGINLVNRQLSLSGSMNLNVVGTAAQPVVLGRIGLTGGDLLFNNERFVLQGGTIDFVNPTVTQPVLNVSVNTTVQQYKVAMRLEGPVDNMRTSYTSDPALPPADIIHLIAFGSTTEAAAANPSPPGNLAAEQKIASAVSSQVTSRVAKIAGLSQLSVNPTLGGPGSQSSPGATITVQQRVTSKIFVTFSTDVTSTQNQVIQLEYQKSRRLSFSGTRDQNGGYAFDTRIRKEW